MRKPTLIDERIRAHSLFVNDGRSVSDIAAILDIHSNTIYGWIKAEDWVKQREDQVISTVAIAHALRKNLLDTLNEINDKRAKGEFVADSLYKRVLDFQRALRDLDSSYDKRSMALAIFQEFTAYIGAQSDSEAVRALKTHMSAFLDTIP
jgi:transposase-like protein